MAKAASRSTSEIIFLLFFFPVVIGFYLIYKYPTWFVPADQVVDTFYWFGKSTGFWYNTVYTGIVCWIAARVVLRSKAIYGKNKKKPLSSYQKKKFISIFFAQLIFFYLVPYFLPVLTGKISFWDTTYKPVNKDAYVYMYNGFTSLGGALYIFVVVPLSVWFFGKRYCSWFCACGNLAETIGITEWGNKWVVNGTPRGKTSEKLEWIQYAFMVFACIFGVVLFLDIWKIFAAGELLATYRAIQDLVVDLMFGALIGIGAYPFLGTRIWCRYGCPLAGFMKLFGQYTKTGFKVAANDNCKGLNLCTLQCPMGISVDSYAHKDKKTHQRKF